PSSGWRYKWYKEQSSDVFQSEGNTFIIRAASGSDEGRYWCRGEREHSNTNTPTSRDVYLYVIDLPNATVTVESPVEPFYPGDTVTLRCDITQYTDWEYYYWYRDNTHIPSNTSKTITISLPTESGQYVCSGRRKTRPQNSSSSQAVTVSYQAELPTPALTVDPQNPVFTGEKVTLKCEVKPSSGWRYKWYKEQSSNVDFQSEGNTFIITAASGSDEDRYWCRGEREHSNTNTPTSRDVYLYVKAPPTATLTVAPQSPVWTGDTVTLRCEVASLTGWRYKWYKGRSQTAVSQSDRYNRTGDTLTIRGAAESDQDQYWCQGERDTRPTSSLISTHLTLTVKDSQSPYLPQVGVRLGLGATILFAIVVVLLCCFKTMSGAHLHAAEPGEQGTQQSLHQDQSEEAQAGLQSNKTAECGTGDVTYIEVQIKELKQRKNTEEASEADTVYSELQPEQTREDAGPSNVIYAQVKIKETE
uniref:Ig-like domain-containing protein n=1 Tax=Denticeps clupeoides TaxID=299321 RepID=A0AAY4AFF9_9TELE